MKIIECSGSPRQIGLQTGEGMRAEVREHLEMYPVPKGREWERRLPSFIEATSRYLPSALAEMKGIAAGADVPVEDIYGMNFDLYPDELSAGEGCTNIVFAGGPNGPIWGKNNEGEFPLPRQRPVCARIVRPSRGIPSVSFIFAGYAGLPDGMNAEGVTVGHSSVGSVFQQSDRHMQILLWSAHALQCSRTTDDFVRTMTSVPLRGKGYTCVVVDRAGRNCSVEAPCPLVQIRRPSSANGVFCVNCYQLPAIAAADRRSPQGKAHALGRKKFLDSALKRRGPWNLKRMKSLLAHHGSPNVCRHGEDDGLHTEYSMIGLPAEGRVLIAHGQPCCTEYKEIRL